MPPIHHGIYIMHVSIIHKNVQKCLPVQQYIQHFCSLAPNMIQIMYCLELYKKAQSLIRKAFLVIYMIVNRIQSTHF